MARVLKTQGRRGEVKVEVLSNVAQRFAEQVKLFALADDGTRQELRVESLWPHQGRLVLKFAGVDSISAAERLLGCELQVPRDQRSQLEPGWTYVSDLIGCIVSDGGREVGKVNDVRFGAGEAPLLIVQAGSKEYEIPYAAAFLENLDIEQKQIRMRLPEGMLEVNAPLTEEEKEHHRNARKISS